MTSSSRYRRAYHDPSGRRHGGVPTFMWRCAPDGLATLRQLAAVGLRPGGQPVAAQVLWRGIGGTRFARLYRIALARPKRTPSPAQLASLERAMTARRTCPTCQHIYDFCIPRSLGECPSCADAAATRTSRGAA